jgi:MFS family permease
MSGPPAGAWAPFRQRVFAVMWTAALVGNIGTWMRDVGAGWLMTEMAPSATWVALVQVAATLPLFLLALPAGALADAVNRRRLLIAVNVVMGLAALVLGVTTQAGAMTPALLVAGLLVAGVASALATPVLQSLTPLQVPRPLLRDAIALNSMGFNVARAIGPAVGGALVAAAGTAAVFYADALSYLAVIGALLWWKGAAAPASADAPERFAPALRTGLRYVMHAPQLQRLLLRAAAFFLFASCAWSLLPLLARQHLGGTAGYYGLLLGALGAGAVGGALLLPRLKARHSAQRLVGAASALAVAVLLAWAWVPHRGFAFVPAVGLGIAWITVLTVLNTAAQTTLPAWVRGRGLAVYLCVFYGSMTAGSLLWGTLADALGLPISCTLAALLGLAGLALAAAKPLPETELDLNPAEQAWPAPLNLLGAADDVPVQVSVDYRIDPAARDAFLQALRELSQARQRNGAMNWAAWEDAADPGAISEQWIEPSWTDHERHHHRHTALDAGLQAAVLAFHRGDAPPRVRHWRVRA